MTRGFALSGGGARGFAHIGILQEVEQNGIAVDYLAGTSAGAVIGALYASGMPPAEIEALALQATWRDVIAIHPTCRSFLSGKRLLAFLERHCCAKRFEDLRIPFSAVAADFQTGESVAFTQGELFPAVLASCSIPAVFPPTVINGKEYIDGGFTEEQIPVITVKNMGSDMVVACDVNYHADSVKNTKTFVTLLFHLFLLIARNNIRKAKQQADVVINVEVGGMSLIKFQQAQELIRRGRQATADVIPKLRESL